MTAPEMKIRRFKPDDREACLALASRLTQGVAPWRDRAAVLKAVKSWVLDSVKSAEEEDRTVIVAEVDGGVVGFVTVGEYRHFTGELDAYVGELVVDVASERQGIGAALMSAAEHWGQQRGRSRLTIETGAANYAARSFYAGIGYLEEEVRLSKRLASGHAD
jgi:ribosomal protein S18 acetylase RimI-like enzyme